MIWFRRPRVSGKTGATSDGLIAMGDAMLVRVGERGMNRPYRAAMLATMSVILGLGLGACTQGAPPAAGANSSHDVQAPVSPSPSATNGAESSAVAAYRAMWADAAVAARTADPKNPRLDDHAEKNALWLLQYVMEQARKAGVTIAGSVAVEPTIVKSDKDKVELRDCIDGSKWVQVKPGGSSGGLSGGRRRAQATVVRISGDTWKVSDLHWQDVGTCIK